MSTVLEAKGLTKAFGGLVAVDSVDLVVKRGTFHAIIGPNGAGKTTLFNLLTGNIAPSSGQILLNGRDITGLPVHRSVHLGMGRSFQITNVFPNLTVFENIRLAARATMPERTSAVRLAIDEPSTMERTAAVVEQVGLSTMAFKPARTLAHGDQRKLELGMIVAADPEVMLLDEPTAGMASNQVPELMALIAAIREGTDKTILLVEHNMRVVMSSSDTVTVMNRGRILAEGTPAEVSDNTEVQDAYLGTLLIGEG